MTPFFVMVIRFLGYAEVDIHDHLDTLSRQ